MTRPAITATILAGICAAAALAQQAPAPAQPGTGTGAAAQSQPAARPVAVQPVRIQRVELEQAYRSDFRSERPLVKAGWLVTIRADGALLAPTALAEPLLLASGEGAAGEGWTASVEWLDHGEAAGERVCFIPVVEAKAQDSAAQPAPRGLRIWFGAAELPERVDAALLQRERARADAAGIAPVAAREAAEAAQRGGEVLRLKDRDALCARMRQLADR